MLLRMPVLASDAEIQFAEQILFNQNGVFDEERINFIKYDATCDLQAVPGSGKTTTLLAKLLILEQKLPFEDGRGILVISHTNAAVNEISNRIRSYCPKLFQYPHFIGTIQSFVDQFLCTPSDFDDIWTSRIPTLELNASHRLQPNVAKVVQALALNPITVTGKFKNKDGTDVSIKPHLLVYDSPTIHQVIPKFVELTKGYITAGQIPADFPHPVKAICWTTKTEDAKIRIGNYYALFNKGEEKLSITYPCLEAYLYEYDKSRKSLATVRKNILNALLKILRLESITETSSEPLTKRGLLDYLQENHKTIYDSLTLDLLRLCMAVVKGDSTTAADGIRTFSIELLKCFGTVASASNDFLTQKYTPLVVPAGERTKPLMRTNVFSHDGIDVEIGTVHSVKGQTHTATLYMESFYERGGGGNYESERLAEQLKGNPLPTNAHRFAKQSMKMTYVGFSRPTHFLCFAVHKSRYDAKLSGLSSD